jgi:two-component system, chemotaxis family, chemotaxis protein CheY
MLSPNAPILVVDDDVAMQQTTTKTLNEAGYSNVRIANNGKEALEIIKAVVSTKDMFKIIILDWNMPEMDGLSFLKICRGDLALKDIAIIMVTAFTDQKNLILALGSGATTFMPKPVSPETLLRKIEQIGNWIDA